MNINEHLQDLCRKNRVALYCTSMFGAPLSWQACQADAYKNTHRVGYGDTAEDSVINCLSQSWQTTDKEANQ